MKSFNLVLRNGVLEETDLGSGALVTYEEARTIEADRDIKAANLQLLVEKVLAYAALDRGAPGEIDAAYNTLVDLARGLKQ